MATFTSAAIGLAGAGANIASYVKQNQLQKDAQRAAKQAAQNLKSIREQNPFQGVQVPTMATKQAMDYVNQQSADSLSALQGTGAEGVIGGVSGLSKNVRDAQLDIAAQQEQAKYNRDVMQAEAQGNINQRRADREYDIGVSELQGAQQAASDAQYNKSQNIQSALSGLSSSVGEFANTDKFDYLNPGARRLKRKTRFKPKSMEEQESEPYTLPNQQQ